MSAIILPSAYLAAANLALDLGQYGKAMAYAKAGPNDGPGDALRRL